jgi:uncharacterized membrane protein YphA (DoxX/SURF4 family)
LRSSRSLRGLRPNACIPRKDGTASSTPSSLQIGFTALVLAGQRFRLIPALLRIFIGVAFVSAIFDRLGLFGGPGTPGVSWGNFQNFISYTAQVNSFLPGRIIPLLAVVESFIEGGLGIAMLLGPAVRPASIASAALLFAFGIAMTVSLGVSSEFSFAVFVLAAGALMIPTVDSALLSLDALQARLSKKHSEA